MKASMDAELKTVSKLANPYLECQTTEARKKFGLGKVNKTLKEGRSRCQTSLYPPLFMKLGAPTCVRRREEK